LGIGKCERE
jgi:hypothetical protein